MEAEDGSSHLPYLQHLLSLQASLVYLFLPAEAKTEKMQTMQKMRTRARFFSVFFSLDLTLEPKSPSGPLGPPAACRDNNRRKR